VDLVATPSQYANDRPLGAGHSRSLKRANRMVSCEHKPQLESTCRAISPTPRRRTRMTIPGLQYNGQSPYDVLDQ
jgi:hypothetical protein